MRKFKIKDHVLDDDKSAYHKKGGIYELSHIDKQGFFCIKTEDGSDFIYREDEIEEVFETILNHQNQFTTDSTQLHKDTDLGYYAGLAMQGLFANPKIETNNDSNATFEDFAKYCIESAKELIKQLNEETK